MRYRRYEYIHEFKERIDEILWLQQKHHEIINSENESTSVKQASLAELHKLNITLANYFDVAPEIVNRSPIPTTLAEENKYNKTKTNTESATK